MTDPATPPARPGRGEEPRSDAPGGDIRAEGVSAAAIVAPDGGHTAWQAAAAAVARKSHRLASDAPDSDVSSRLARRTVSGMTIPPLGTPTLAAAASTRSALAADPGAAPFLRGSAASGSWSVRAAYRSSDAAATNTAILADLAGGVTSLRVAVGRSGLASDALALALGGVDLSAVPLVLDDPTDGLPHPAAGDAAAHDPAVGDRDAAGAGSAGLAAANRAATDTLVAAGSALARAAEPAGLHSSVSLGADPLRVWVRTALFSAVERASDTDGRSAAYASVAASTVDIARAATNLGIGAVVVDGSAVHDAGASDAQEIGYTLAAGAAYLRMLTAAGFDVDAACRLLAFRYAVTDEQFIQVAKLRAARLAWARVCDLSGASPRAAAQVQHAVTSAPMMTRYDAHTNMLRTTIAAFAAAIGGAASVAVAPFDAALRAPDEFARRMARNVSALLSGEATVGDVADPAGGAHAVEILTAELAEAAWAELARIEGAGGILAACADGSLAARVDDVRAERTRRVATRRRPITGVSEFPDAGESALAERTDAPYLRRWAEPFEAMRDAPPPGSVLILRIGTEAAASPRVTYAQNLLAAGGVAVTLRPAGTSATDVAAAVLAGRARVVVFAGSDADYEAVLADYLRAARTAGAAALFLAGRPQKLLATLPDRAVDGTIAAGDDAFAVLTRLRDELGTAR